MLYIYNDIIEVGPDSRQVPPRVPVAGDIRCLVL